MGDESRVTQAIGRVQRHAPRQQARMKSRLERVYQTHNEAAEARDYFTFRDRPLLWGGSSRGIALLICFSHSSIFYC